MPGKDKNGSIIPLEKPKKFPQPAPGVRKPNVGPELEEMKKKVAPPPPPPKSKL